jgi:hypothetical protein
MTVRLLINLNSISALIEPVLVLISGMLAFVAGLAIVRLHNHWAGDWRVLLVTILNWLLLVGVVRVWFPIGLAGVAASLGRSTGCIAGEAGVLLVIDACIRSIRAAERAAVQRPKAGGVAGWASA